MNLNARPLIALIGGRGLDIPTEPWNASRFAKSGAHMMIALHRVAQITQRRAGRELAKTLKHTLNAQVAAVIAIATGEKSAKAFGNDETIWGQAMHQAFDEEDIAISIQVKPSIQKVLAQGYARTNILLGQPDITTAADIARQARGLADRVSRVNDTTRRTIAKIVRNSISEGLTVTETADVMRTVLPKINSNRALTIARTEMSNAWTQGSVRSFQESETVTHVSVIGCASREEDMWGEASYQQYMYRNESTCEIQDVPVYDADKLNFHPNHAGTIIASAFRD